MGKVRKIRQKYHLSLKKSKSLSNLSEPEIKVDNSSLNKNAFKSTENIFAGLDISFDELTKSLPKDFDVRSVISTKSRKELKEEEKHLKKKEKQKLRHERFMQKLEISRAIMQKDKTKKKKHKRKKQLGGDMKSLLDALPDLESLQANVSQKPEKVMRKSKGVLKAKHRLKQQSFDSKLFKKILDDRVFKENPLQTINQFLKQKVQMSS